MLATVPRSVIVASAVPSPETKLSPAVPASVSVPLVTVRVTSSGLLPASASDMEIALPLPEENTLTKSSLVV